MNSDQIEAARSLIELTRALIRSRETGFGITLSDDDAQVFADAADTLERYLDD
jgi:hypothetical protein